MVVDGLHALATGSYIGTGAHGELGPWSVLVRSVGLAPTSHVVRVAFVVVGLAYLVAVAGYAAHRVGARRALAVLAIATLWYLPFGTLCSLLLLIGLWTERARTGHFPNRR